MLLLRLFGVVLELAAVVIGLGCVVKISSFAHGLLFSLFPLLFDILPGFTRIFRVLVPILVPAIVVLVEHAVRIKLRKTCVQQGSDARHTLRQSFDGVGVGPWFERDMAFPWVGVMLVRRHHLTEWI